MRMLNSTTRSLLSPERRLGWFVCLAMGLCLGQTQRMASGSELRRSPIVKAAESARASIVNIHGQKTITAEQDPSLRGEAPKKVNGMGTGVFIDERGYILTNHHVVDGVKKIEVTLADRTTHIARFIASNPSEDLAVIKIDAQREFPIPTLGTSSDLLVGETVIAVGNAYGYDHTVSSGIISALHRSVQINETQSYEDLVQTTADINPGNSGGPLINIDGDVIAINVAVRAGANGIGFAIPIDRALGVASELLSVARLENRWHGITLKSISEQGAVIQAVEKNSPAEQAGLKPGDVLQAIEHRPLSRQLDLERILLGRKNNEPVELKVKRQSEYVETKLSLAAKPKIAEDNDKHWQILGLKLAQIPAQQFKQGTSRYRGGLQVLNVRPDSPAAKQGIRKGDILVGMHIWETITLDNVDYVLSRDDLEEFAPIKFLLMRNGETLFGHLPVTLKR
jgi:serine protease Do